MLFAGIADRSGDLWHTAVEHATAQHRVDAGQPDADHDVWLVVAVVADVQVLAE